jgi:hypothetical protein
MTSRWPSILFLIASACGDDSSVTDAGTRSDAGARVDAGPRLDGSLPDAGGDAGAAPDAGDGGSSPACSDCVAQTLTWGNEGGFVAFERVAEIQTCNTYVLTETRFGGPTMSCTNSVPCDGEDAIVMAEVLAALANPEVVAAFDASGTIYGRDSRPVDGTILRIASGSDEFFVGQPCDGRGCIDIPLGVDALAALLRALTEERLAEEDCATIFP